MITETNAPARAADGAPPPALSRAGLGKVHPPADIIHDNEQIFLEVLRGRAAEEERRRFVAGVKRLDGSKLTEE